MKVLSLKQPWAQLVVEGKKKIELRKWNTHFRGKFLIHASKNPDMNAIEKFNLDLTKLPLGFIIGEATITKVKDYAKNKKEFKQDSNLHLANNSWGNYGFVLENPKQIPPIPAKGQLNFWNFDLKNP